jgi:hypothetical protein
MATHEPIRDDDATEDEDLPESGATGSLPSGWADPTRPDPKK